MLSDEEILKSFHSNKDTFVEWREWWLANEVRDNYAAVEGDNDIGVSAQWEEGLLDKRKKDFLPCLSINKLQPVVDTISGFQVQNRTIASYQPRTLKQPNRNFIDLVNDGIEYIYQDSGGDFENTMAFRDTLICGLGAVDHNVSMDENPEGDPEIQRRAPYLVGWDTAARKKNIVDANHVWSGTLVNSETYLEEVNEKRKENKKPALASLASADGDDFVSAFNTADDLKNLSVEYKYQWRVKEPFYQVSNEFLNYPQKLAELQQLGTLKEIADKYSFDPTQDRIINVSTDLMDDLTRMYEAVGITEFKKVKQRTYRYYWAKIIGDDVIESGEHYSQKCFSLKFITGKWSESRQCFYGVVRAAKEPQRLLNRAVSDWSSYISTNPWGGLMVEKGAVGVKNLKGFVENYLKMANITFFEDGALTQGKVQPKPVAQTPAALVDMIMFASSAILETSGVNSDFMGQGQGGQNDYDALTKRVRQGLTALAPYFDAYSQFTIEQGRISIDMLRVMAENSGGKVIRNISEVAEEDGSVNMYRELLADDIATEYDIITKEVPKTPDEQREMLDTLLRYAEVVGNSGGNPQGLLPIITEYVDFPSDVLEQVKLAIAPPEPQPPDPVNQDLLVSQTNLNNAQAKKLVAEAKNKGIQTLMDYKDLENLPLKLQEMQANIEKLLSQAALNEAKAHTEMQPQF